MLVARPSKFMQILGFLFFLGFGIVVLYITSTMRGADVYIGIGMSVFAFSASIYSLYCVMTGAGAVTIEGSLDAPTRSVKDRLLELDDLQRRGLIDDVEYRTQRTRILSRL